MRDGDLAATMLRQKTPVPATPSRTRAARRDLLLALDHPDVLLALIVAVWDREVVHEEEYGFAA